MLFEQKLDLILSEYTSGKGPKFDTLEKNKIKLTPDERDEVMKAKAIWHHGPQDKNGNGAPSPAVWKANVKGKDWYITNTHRAYNVSPTLKGSIGRYHKFIKGTA